MNSTPTPEQLWRQAGGGTPSYSREQYRNLMIEHGLLVPLAPGEKPEPLPCGWPTRDPVTGYVFDPDNVPVEYRAMYERVDSALRAEVGRWLPDHITADDCHRMAWIAVSSSNETEAT